MKSLIKYIFHERPNEPNTRSRWSLWFDGYLLVMLGLTYFTLGAIWAIPLGIIAEGYIWIGCFLYALMFPAFTVFVRHVFKGNI